MDMMIDVCGRARVHIKSFDYHGIRVVHMCARDYGRG